MPRYILRLKKVRFRKDNIIKLFTINLRCLKKELLFDYGESLLRKNIVEFILVVRDKVYDNIHEFKTEVEDVFGTFGRVDFILGL